MGCVERRASYGRLRARRERIHECVQLEKLSKQQRVASAVRSQTRYAILLSPGGIQVFALWSVGEGVHFLNVKIESGQHYHE